MDFMKRTLIGKMKLLSLTLTGALFLCSCTGRIQAPPSSPDPNSPEAIASTLPEAPFSTGAEFVKVTIPGMKDTVRLTYFSDLHIVTDSDQVAEADKQTVKDRINWAVNSEGTTAADQWKTWPGFLDKTGADAILFGGDMVDFASESNLNALGLGLSEISTPFLYVRADHDMLPFNLTGVTEADCLSYQNSVNEMSDVCSIEYPDFIIVGWNNSTSNLTEEGKNKIMSLCEKQKPMILLTHVPIEPLEDTSLETASRQVFQNRSLLWGKSGNTYYVPDENTSFLLDLIYRDNSPFKEVLCGHLHFSWDGNITPDVHQHVFSAAFQGYYGIVTVSGE